MKNHRTKEFKNQNDTGNKNKTKSPKSLTRSDSKMGMTKERVSELKY
jgi:hypothetical protein